MPTMTTMMVSQSALCKYAAAASSSTTYRRHVEARGCYTRRPMRRAAAAAPAHAAAGSERAKPSTTVTDMYLYLQELEREAERAEVECATHANSTSAQNECTTKFLDASDEIELARLAARAAGVAEEPEGKVARAGVKKARTNKAAALQAAAEEEMNCIESGGGAECTVAFNDAWDQAEELEKDAVLRCRRILRGWVATHKQHA